MDHFDGADHLAMRGGFREADVLEVTRAALRDGLLEVTTSECGVLVRVPVHPGSAAVLATAPRHDAATIAANQSGQPGR